MNLKTYFSLLFGLGLNEIPISLLFCKVLVGNVAIEDAIIMLMFFGSVTMSKTLTKYVCTSVQQSIGVQNASWTFDNLIGNCEFVELDCIYKAHKE